MPLSRGDQENFETLTSAFRHGEVALLECQLVSTGQPVATICAVNRHDDGSCSFVPIAQMFSENPYAQINAPSPDHDGFVTQVEVWGEPLQNS
jgi:hypothetical protein